MTSTSINDNVLEIRRFNQYLGAFVVSLSGFALGVSLGWNSSAGEIFRNHLDAGAVEIGLVGGVLNVGCAIGAILAPFIARRIARTTMMIIVMPVLLVAWVLICIGDQKVILLMIGRVLCGICGGMFCVFTPTYVAEVADKEIRRRLLGFFQLLINWGVMYAFLVAHMIDERHTVWRYSSICGIPCILMWVAKLLPESPLYYLSRNDKINAEKSLRWYRGNTYDIQHEMTEMNQLIVITRSSKISFEMLTNRRVLRSIASCCGIMLGHHLCGLNMMLFYALTLFNVIGSGDLTGSEQTLIVGGVQIFASFLAIFLMDILGRRFLATVSTLLMGLFLALLGWFFSLRDADPEYDDIYSWMPPTWITFFFASFNIGLGPVSWSLLGDTLPIELRMPVASAAVAIGWLVSLMAILTFEEMLILLGGTRIMWLSAAICWVISLFCIIIIKDTNRKSLTELQESFGAESNRNIGET